MTVAVDGIRLLDGTGHRKYSAGFRSDDAARYLDAESSGGLVDGASILNVADSAA